MTQHRPGTFIHDEMESILQAWEDFAADLATPQSGHERCARSKGLGKRGQDDTAAETHAEARLRSGYTVGKVDVESSAADRTTFTMTMPRLPAGLG
jgi:hypothetical protein